MLPLHPISIQTQQIMIRCMDLTTLDLDILALGRLYSVSNAKNKNNKNKYNQDNPDPNIETGLLNEGNGELGTVRARNIKTIDGISERGNLLVYTFDITSRSLKENTSRSSEEIEIVLMP